jgi:hypothetical protein
LHQPLTTKAKAPRQRLAAVPTPRRQPSAST